MSITAGIFLAMFVVMGGCVHSEREPLRGTVLCEQLESICINEKWDYRIDSLVALSTGLSGAERHAVLCRMVSISGRRGQEQWRDYYNGLLDKESFPDADNKYEGFLLLEQYTLIKSRKPKAPDIEKITGLLFDMENRWRLTTEEQCRLQTVKSLIYSFVLHEYASAISIAEKALDLAEGLHIDEMTMMKIYKAFYQSYLNLDKDNLPQIRVDDFLDYADRHRFNSAFKKEVGGFIGILYLQRKNFKRAYDWMDVSDRNEMGYNSQIVPLYLGLDSIPEAFAYVDLMRKKTSHEVTLAMIAWAEACIHLKAGNMPQYERCLKESVGLFDKYRNARNEVDFCAPSEAYTHLLWSEGKRDEAIRRMEIITRKLTDITSYNSPVIYDLNDNKTRIDRLRSIVGYYREAGHYEKALRQSQLCDSLELVLSKAQLQAEKQKTEARMYVADLARNLELKAAILDQERHRTYAVTSLLVLALMAATLFAVLYRRREKQLNILYTKQKKIESLQQEKQMASGMRGILPGDEQLFRQLEEQMLTGRLFLNPGLSLDDLCRAGASNRMYVSSSINKYSGMNFNQWVNKSRIDYALELICTGEDDLQKLAENSGFSSVKSFFRSFKQFTELSPRQYIIRERQKVVS